MSLDASGSLAGALVFSKWKGRNYARQLVIPANPKTGGQVGMRSMFKFLSQEWNGLSDSSKATWESRADDGVYSTFNAFMSYNQKRWRDFMGPTHDDPAAEASTPAATTTGVATPSERTMTLAITDGAPPPDWGYAIFRGLTTGFTPSWSNCVAVVEWNVGGVTTYIDSPLDPDEYFYVATGLNDDGIVGIDGTEFSGIIT